MKRGKKASREELLNDPVALDILDLFLLNPKDGIRWNEFEKALSKDKKYHPQKIKYRLKQLVEEDILLHEEKKQPYYLKKKYYNLIAKKYNVRFIESYPSNYMIPKISQDLYGTIYGFDIYQLYDYERKELGKALENLDKALDILNDIKQKQFEKCCNDIFDKLSKKIDDKKREFLIKKWKIIVWFSFMRVTTIATIFSLPKEELVNFYSSLEQKKELLNDYAEFPQFFNKKQIKLLSEATYLLTIAFANLHPFNYGISVFENLEIPSYSLASRFKLPKVDDEIRLKIGISLSQHKNIDVKKFINFKLKTLGKKKEEYEKKDIPIPGYLKKEIQFYKKMKKT